MVGRGDDWDEGRKRDGLESGIFWKGMKEEWRVPWRLGLGGLRVREEKEEEREETDMVVRECGK